MRGSSFITALEYERIPIGIGAGSLTVQEAGTLDVIAGRLRGFCERSHSTVRFSNYCGLVNLGGRILEILPKVGFDPADSEDSRALLLKLLRDAGSIDLAEQAAVGHRLSDSTLFELFIGAFFRNIRKLAKGGLRRLYVEERDDLVVVRGRIDVTRQLSRLANRPDVIACEFDELSIDNLWNRAIKRAHVLVRPWIRSMALQREWIELGSLFAEVSDVPVNAETIEALHEDRGAVRYRAVMSWVVWILRLLAPSVRAGEKSAPGLLFDMNRVFESCIERAIRRGARDLEDVQVAGQDTSRHLANLDSETGPQVLALRPDLVVRRGGSICLIADAKWKLIDTGGANSPLPAMPDAYQLYAYSSAFKCHQLVLIYPAHRAVMEPRIPELFLPALNGVRPKLRLFCVDIASKDYRIANSSERLPIASLLSS